MHAIQAGGVAWQFPTSTQVHSGRNRPQELKALAKYFGLSFDDVLEAAYDADLKPVSGVLFDPDQVSRACIKAGKYPTIRGA